MRCIGFVVNPIAGMGGKVGLKGSDGNAWKQALSMGAKAESGQKALITLKELARLREPPEILTYPGKMGEDVCREAKLPCRVLEATPKAETTAADTREAAARFLSEGVELILFAGGDGTARDILDAVGSKVPVLGIPTGCKIHSGVYAFHPRAAAAAVRYGLPGGFADTREAEVMDIDEDLFRRGIVQARLYGYLTVPATDRFIQNQKSGSSLTEKEEIESIAAAIANGMQADVLYIVGTGSTMAALMRELELPGTLLGVDLVYNRKLLAADCTEKDILAAMEKYPRRKLLVTVIGGQGYIFGRGNQQLSAQVLKKLGRENILVAAAKTKLLALKGQPLHVDTGSEDVDTMLSGYIRVRCGYNEEMAMKVTV